MATTITLPSNITAVSFKGTDLTKVFYNATQVFPAKTQAEINKEKIKASTTGFRVVSNKNDGSDVTETYNLKDTTNYTYKEVCNGTNYFMYWNADYTKLIVERRYFETEIYDLDDLLSGDITVDLDNTYRESNLEYCTEDEYKSSTHTLDIYVEGVFYRSVMACVIATAEYLEYTYDSEHTIRVYSECHTEVVKDGKPLYDNAVSLYYTPTSSTEDTKVIQTPYYIIGTNDDGTPITSVKVNLNHDKEVHSGMLRTS